MWLSALDGRKGIGFGRSEPMKEEEEWKEKMKREMTGWTGDLAAAEPGG